MFVSARPFLFGSLNESGSTVGMNELLRVFPERRAQFYFLTWNLMGLSISVRSAPSAFTAHCSPHLSTPVVVIDATPVRAACAEAARKPV